MPGGAMEWGEHPFETAERELDEETGLQAEIGRIVGVFSRWYSPQETASGNAGHVIGIVYEASNVRGVLRTEFSRDAENTTDAAAWFTLEEARALPHVGLVTYCLDLCDEIGRS
jgi:8-oxo-dGTP diphosphatase